MRVGSFPVVVRLSVSNVLSLLLALSCLLSIHFPQVSLAQRIEADGRQFVALHQVARHFGMRGYWLEPDKLFRLAGKYTNLDFTKNSRFMKINEMPVYLGFSTVEVDGLLFMSMTDFQHVLQPILTPQLFKNRPETHRIVIDVGHGGKDTGARNDNYGLMEKKLNLDIAVRLKRLLEKAGFEVKLTRTSDVFLPLEKRPTIANRFKADFFISLHFNSAASLEAAGFEVFAFTPQHQPSTKQPRLAPEDSERFLGNKYDPWNILAAYHVERALVLGLSGPDRGVKRARFLVLRDLNCPGVLVELGFLSHVETAKKLRSSDFRELLAESLCQGIVAYRERLERIQ